jgi:hypothetical protein
MSIEDKEKLVSRVKPVIEGLARTKDEIRISEPSKLVEEYPRILPSVITFIPRTITPEEEEARRRVMEEIKKLEKKLEEKETGAGFKEIVAYAFLKEEINVDDLDTTEVKELGGIVRALTDEEKEWLREQTKGQEAFNKIKGFKVAFEIRATEDADKEKIVKLLKKLDKKRGWIVLTGNEMEQIAGILAKRLRQPQKGKKGGRGRGEGTKTTGIIGTFTEVSDMEMEEFSIGDIMWDVGGKIYSDRQFSRLLRENPTYSMSLPGISGKTPEEKTASEARAQAVKALLVGAVKEAVDQGKEKGKDIARYINTEWYLARKNAGLPVPLTAVVVSKDGRAQWQVISPKRAGILKSIYITPSAARKEQWTKTRKLTLKPRYYEAFSGKTAGELYSISDPYLKARYEELTALQKKAAEIYKALKAKWDALSKKEREAYTATVRGKERPSFLKYMQATLSPEEKEAVRSYMRAAKKHSMLVPRPVRIPIPQSELWKKAIEEWKKLTPAEKEAWKTTTVETSTGKLVTGYKAFLINKIRELSEKEETGGTASFDTWEDFNMGDIDTYDVYENPDWVPTTRLGTLLEELDIEENPTFGGTIMSEASRGLMLLVGAAGAGLAINYGIKLGSKYLSWFNKGWAVALTGAVSFILVSWLERTRFLRNVPEDIWTGAKTVSALFIVGGLIGQFFPNFAAMFMPTYPATSAALEVGCEGAGCGEAAWGGVSFEDASPAVEVETITPPSTEEGTTFAAGLEEVGQAVGYSAETIGQTEYSTQVLPAEERSVFASEESDEI